MKRRHLVAWCVSLLVLLACAAVALTMVRDRQRFIRRVEAQTRGNVHHGQRAILHYGCGGCHDIPGVAVAQGQVGPPLKGVGQRTYIAGRLRNTPDNMALWIAHPRKVDPRTAMPDLAVSDADARDITAYLYTRN